MKYTLTLMSMFLTCILNAKNPPPIELPNFGYVFELTDQFQTIAGESGNKLGLRGGLTYNQHFAASVSFKWSLTKIYPSTEADPSIF